MTTPTTAFTAIAGAYLSGAPSALLTARPINSDTTEQTIWNSWFLGGADIHAIYARIAGSWTEMNKYTHVKVAGTWRRVPKVFIKVNGTWVQYNQYKSYK